MAGARWRGRARSLLVAAVAVSVAVGACSGDPSSTETGDSEPTGDVTDLASTETTAAPPEQPGSGQAGSGQAGSDGCGVPVAGLPANRTISRTMESAGGERTYLVYVPETYDVDEPAPVAFTFHGAGSNKEQQIAYSAFAPYAEEDGALVVAPDALGQPRRWSPYGGATISDGAGLAGVRDLDFFTDLLDELEATFCVDATRVWVTGMSSGGFMTATIACEYSGVIAAAAPVTATAWSDTACGDAQPVPYAYFHGTDDPVVPFLGPVPGPNGEPGPGAAEVSSEQWAVHNGCDPEPSEDRVGEEVLHRWWEGCDASTDLYIVEGGGHTWPGGIDVPQLGHTTRDISATEIIWDLFRASTRPQ